MSFMAANLNPSLAEVSCHKNFTQYEQNSNLIWILAKEEISIIMDLHSSEITGMIWMVPKKIDRKRFLVLK